MMNRFIILLYLPIYTLCLPTLRTSLYGFQNFLTNTICKQIFDQYRNANDQVNPERDLAVICHGPTKKNFTLPITPETGQKIIDSNVFDPKLKMYIFLCGIYDDPKAGYSLLMIDGLEATTGPYNYIVLDYTKISGRSHMDLLRTMYLGFQMSDHLTEVLLDLYAKEVIDPSRIHIVGMSLGGQMAGRIGRQVFKRTGRKIARITGLDHAGPCFDFSDEYLTKDDTDYLELVHSQIGILGTVIGNAHINYLPNGGGSSQPGCPWFAVCGHSRACDFYAGALWNKTLPFYARKCGSWLSFLLGDCNQNDLTTLASSDTTKRGHYYFKTTASSPYSLGLAGASCNGKNVFRDLLKYYDNNSI